MLQFTLSLVAIFIALCGVWLIWRLWRQRSWFVAWLKGSAGLVIALVVVLLLLSIWDLWSYRRLGAEQNLVTVSVTQLGQQQFELQLIDSQGRSQSYQLQGDQWQLDVRLFTWSGPFMQLGQMPLYRLDRLSGRYLALEQERNRQRTVYDLSPSTGFDLWLWLQKYGFWLDAQYGSAVFMPLTDGAMFAVKLTAKGIIARPLNESAERALSVGW